jgi:hypothetical protein
MGKTKNARQSSSEIKLLLALLQNGQVRTAFLKEYPSLGFNFSISSVPFDLLIQC